MDIKKDIVNELFERMYPYIILTSIIFILIFLMAIMIIYILIRK